MAIQFRTRTKSSIDYSTDLKSTGVCCEVNGTKTQKTLLECFQIGGNFQYGNIDEVTCPTAGEIGCCCACNATFARNYNIDGDYVVSCGEADTTIEGLQNTTKCECDRLGGKWTSGACPTSTMSVQGARSRCLTDAFDGCQVDARIPRACCYMQRDELNVPIGITCQNVCRSADCVGYTLSSEPAIFSKEKICNGTLGGNPAQNCSASKFASLITTNTELFEDFEYGSCFDLQKTNGAYSYECKFTNESSCDGYWTAMLGDMKVCNHAYAPQVPVKSGSRIIEPEAMSELAFDSLELNIGSFYKGGIYIGKYEPGSPITASGSDLYGSEPSEQNAHSLKSSASSKGEKQNKKWILLVEPKIYTTSFLDSTEVLQTAYTNLSKYDGFYNFYGDNKTFNGIKSKLTNTICGKNRKSFVDFYVPSLQELEFFTNQYKTYAYSIQQYFIPKGAFMTSTLYRDKLLYSQYLSLYDSTNYGRVVLSTLTTKLSILFFRRILLT